jgi:hypothetical protein
VVSWNGRALRLISMCLIMVASFQSTLRQGHRLGTEFGKKGLSLATPASQIIGVAFADGLEDRGIADLQLVWWELRGYVDHPAGQH